MKFKSSNKHSNGDWVNQHRKNQGKFLEKQGNEAYLFSKKLNNGNSIQGKNTLNTDDLPNISAVLDYKLNLSRQNSIEPIDGGKAHTPIAQLLLPVLTALSAISSNITVSSKKAISTDNQNSLPSTVKSFTEMSKPPVLFDTISATISTSQNHDKSKGPTKHSKIKLAKSDQYEQSQLNDDQSRVKRATDDYTIYGNKLIFAKASLDTKSLKQKLEENSNITDLRLWNTDVDSQKAQEIGTILKNSKVSKLTIKGNRIGATTWIKKLMVAIKDINISVLELSSNKVSSKDAKEIGENLKDTKVQVLHLANNNIGDEGAIDIIKSLSHTKVVTLNLIGNNISSKGAEDLRACPQTK
jgi:hypothetical protein